MAAKITSLPPIIVTMGDPAGVGPRLVAEAWLQRRKRALPPFVFIGAPEVFNRQGTDIPVEIAHTPSEILNGDFGEALTVYPITLKARALPGEPSQKNAQPILKSIEVGVKAIEKGFGSSLVTCPINKKVLLEANFKHIGHTGFLGELTGAEPVMMLANEEIRVVPVTVHLPLKDVPKVLTKNRIVETAKIVAHDLEKRFGIHNPRLALTGLNPHAGEEGKLGDEEIKTIIPALKEIRSLGIFAEGPFPADTAFTQPMRMKYDAFLAMTHDQALIPIKTLDFRKTVNLTLGLPIVRTSPAHGTAFDLVKDGRTPDPESFIQALLMADRLSS
ncbi:MAG: 4-hydroxythreonine-4-phosphate dehydrogenase PdxA [Sphingomonadales bacterium]